MKVFRENGTWWRSSKKLVKMVYDSSHKQVGWFESENQVIWIKKREHMKTRMCDSSHSTCESSHMIRAINIYDLS